MHTRQHLSLILSLLVLGGLASGRASSQNSLPAISPLPRSGKLKPSSTDHFRFVVAGDNRPSKDKDPFPPSVAYIFSQVKKLSDGKHGAAFVVWTGDTIYGKDNADEKKIKKEYDAFKALASACGVPVFNAPGNHEMCIKGKKIDAYDPTGNLAAWYTKHMGAPYGTFTYGNCAFILLNTDDRLDSGVTIPADEYNGYLSSEQIDGVKTALAGYAAKKSIQHVFVFMHRPIYAWPLDAQNALGAPSHDPLQSLLSDYKDYPNLSFVFAAHEHLFYRYDPKKPTDPNAHTEPVVRKDPAKATPVFVVSGGAGAPLTKKATPKTGGFNNYLVVDVDKDKVTCSVVVLPASAPGATGTASIGGNKKISKK